LTPVATRCSMRARKTILGRWQTSKSVLQPRPLAWNTLQDCVGRMVSYALSVGRMKRGGQAGGCGAANIVASRLLQLLARFSIAPVNHCVCGFARCGTSPPRNTVPILLVLDESLSQGAMKPFGSGCTNSEGRW
jgi:hypothetical protein